MLVFKVKSRNSRTCLGNKGAKELHNLKDERPGCRIEDIFLTENAVGFSPDTLAAARNSGYTNTCPYCMPPRKP